MDKHSFADTESAVGTKRVNWPLAIAATLMLALLAGGSWWSRVEHAQAAAHAADRPDR